MILDINDAIDHLNEIIRVLEDNDMKTKEDDDCYKVIEDFINTQRIYEDFD